MNRTYTRALFNLPSDTKEAWLFESYEERLKIQTEWSKQGKEIKLHSAYKSLIHYFLENQIISDTKKILIKYPVIEEDEPQRFRLECYPITDLFDAEISFEAMPQTLHEGQLPYYEVISDAQTQQIPVPVRWVNKIIEKRQLVACGWIINQQGQGQHLTTEFEDIYHDACEYLSNIPLHPIEEEQKHGPFFGRLTLHIDLPMEDVKLAHKTETISLIEAMHEDIYFTAMEIFQYRLGLKDNDRGLMPGQISPEVNYASQASLAISIEDLPKKVTDTSPMLSSLDNVEHWLTPKQIANQLKQLEGKAFSVMSRQGCEVQGCAILHGSPLNIAISGGQHANESSGIVGALRAAQTLKTQGNVDFTVTPLENPDGYNLFQHLCKNNPEHMHHAARYTAGGNDINYGTHYESLIRDVAKKHLLADVHINLHGYPAHEWTRPLSGYVPKGFATWTIPKGFFIICRYQPGFKAQANLLLNAAINAVVNFDLQKKQNQHMLNSFLSIVEGANFEIAKDVVPYMINESQETDYPIEIITEAPDETIYGEAFRIAHESHYRVILAIVKALRTSLDSDNSNNDNLSNDDTISFANHSL